MNIPFKSPAVANTIQTGTKQRSFGALWLVAGIMTLLFGFAAGWWGREFLLEKQHRQRDVNNFITALIGAHTLFAGGNAPRVEFGPDRFGDFAQYGSSAFGIMLHQPQLDGASTRFAGARVVPLRGAVSGMLLFESGNGYMSAIIFPQNDGFAIPLDRVLQTEPRLFVTRKQGYIVAFVGGFEETSQTSLIGSVFQSVDGDDDTPALNQ